MLADNEPRIKHYTSRWHKLYETIAKLCYWEESYFYRQKFTHCLPCSNLFERPSYVFVAKCELLFNNPVLQCRVAGIHGGKYII